MTSRPKHVRRPGDFYPTPADAAWALRSAILDGKMGDLSARLYESRCTTVLDPAAGAGSLLDWTAPSRGWTRSIALELNSALAEECAKRGHLTYCLDALAAVTWPSAPMIIANPPFSLLTDFVLRIQCALVDHLREGRGAAVAHVLLPTSWLQAASRRTMPKPDLALLSWRPQFLSREDTNSGPRDTYAWATWTSLSVLKPRAMASWTLLQRPEVPRELVGEHAVISAIVKGLE